jgi:hypothetical protein
MSAVSDAELSGFLNMLPEAERAGAKTLAAFLEEIRASRRHGNNCAKSSRLKRITVRYLSMPFMRSAPPRAG